MKNFVRFAIALSLVAVMLHLSAPRMAEACGPSYLTPVFDYSYAPERPWTDFANGKLGIIKPTYRRIVLIAAYRYLNGSGFGQDEQTALIESWEAQFNRKEPPSNDVSGAVREWVAQRKSIVGEEEKTPEIYAERRYNEGYNFFPNCSKNAFEVAKKTLADRARSYGSDSKDVKEWVKGQDQVFMNCAEDHGTLEQLSAEWPAWLQKDRDYQLAAAAFYSLKYDEAQAQFEKIAQDGESPWRELADYLVARTLVRRGNLVEDNSESNKYNLRAEEYLNQLTGRAVTYHNDARRLLNLVKYRLHPEERVHELAQKLPFQNDSSELRQDLIDYTWLLDEFESEALKKEEERKEALKPKETSAANSANSNANAAFIPQPPPTPDPSDTLRDIPGGFANANYAPNANAYANSANAIVNAAYSPQNSYNGSYYGSETLSLAILPEFLGQDPLTEWLFTFQAQSDDSYFHAVDRWHQTSSDMWLMTAMTKARNGLGGLKELMEAAKNANPESPAFPTIAYHRLRLLMDLKQDEEARKLLADVLDGPRDLPISTRNLFTAQRLRLSQSLNEFITSSLRKPFGFAYDEDTARTIDEIIAERKSWYDPEYSEGSQAQYDLDIEKEFAEKRLWQDRSFFDDKSVDIINEHFSTAQMIEVLNNPAMPDYLKRRLTIAIWTRAYLLKDAKTALAMAPAVVKLKPDVESLMTAYTGAKTPAERETAGLYLLLKTGEMSPFLQAGFDYEPQEDFDIWQDDRWWCEQYDYSYDDYGNEVQKASYIPPFLTKPMLTAAKTQNSALKKTSDGVSYLSGRVLDWAKTGVPDKRLPESLYIVFQANRWVKYSCGNYSEETRAKAGDILKKRYPNSKWTQQMFNDLKEEG